MPRRLGFTQLELVIVIGLMIVTLAAAIPILNSFRQTQTLRTIAQDVFHTIVLARHRAQTSERGMGWGVSMQSGSYVLFAGPLYADPSYADREASYDEVRDADATMQFSGLTEIAFRRATALPVATGALIITDLEGGTVTITVNSAGGLTME